MLINPMRTTYKLDIWMNNTINVQRRLTQVETMPTKNNMSERNIKGLNFDMNDEKTFSDYMDFTFHSSLGDNVEHISNSLYTVGLSISNNDTYK